MPSRALIIAIENYPPNPDLATTLPGTHDNARAFRSWLKGSAGFSGMTAAEEPSRIIIATDDPNFPGRTHDASARGIRRAVQALWTAGQDSSTGELFVYYSGHGFLFKESEGSRAADVIVPGDFADMMVDGALCFRLDRLQLELLQGLGAGNHYYFIDACRNQIGSDQIDVGSPVRLKRSSQREAQVFTLFSTSRLSVAPAASPFTNLLVAGLDGRGKAKRPAGGVPPRMRVVWASLLEYMKGKLPEVDGRGDGASPSVLWEGPVQPKTCTIVVDNAEPTDRFTVNPADSMGRPQLTFQFQGASFQWQQPPDDYHLEVTHPDGIVKAVDPVPPKPVDLFEDASARFVLEKPPAGGVDELEGARGWSGAVPERPVPAATQIDVLAPEGSRVRMINPVSGETWENPAAFASVARPGSAYVIEAFDRDNTLMVRRDLALALGEHRTLDLRFPDTPLRQALAARFSSSPDAGIAFSESLGGSITDPDLGLWLALIAASRVLGPDRFSKLQRLPLQRFEDIPPGGSALYVLAGFDDAATTLQVGVGTGAINHGWHIPAAVAGLPGLTELKLVAQPGGLLVSFAAGESATLTIASYALANRATIITVTGAPGDLRIQQFLAPIYTLEAHLDPAVRDLLPNAPLRGIKFLAQSQRLLRARRSVSASTGQVSEWIDALSGKWLDPMAGIVACYELLRMGRAPELNVALDNLALHFSELPDTAALLRLAGRPGGAPPSSPPMMTDGFAAFADGTFRVLPESKLEYGALWTTWRNAIARETAPVAGVRA